MCLHVLFWHAFGQVEMCKEAHLEDCVWDVFCLNKHADVGTVGSKT